MSRVDELRDRMIDLRAAERELVALTRETEATLTENRAEQKRVKAQLLLNARTEVGSVRVDASRESARGTIARLGRFTMSEAMAELGWPRPRVQKLFDVMLCQVPPALILDGTLGRRAVYRYTGPPIEQADPAADRQAAELEAVRDWVVTQARFTPAECAAAVELPRASALRALRQLAELNVVADIGLADMPIFEVVGAVVDVVDVAVSQPALQVVATPAVSSPIPQIQELLDAAQAARCDVSGTPDYFAIEALDGTRVLIAAKPRGRQQMLEDKAKLRRIGVAV